MVILPPQVCLKPSRICFKKVGFIAVLFISLLFSGCHKETQEISLAETYDKIENFNDTTPSSPVSSSYRECVSYKVNKIKWKDDTGVATVTVFAPDLNKIILDCVDRSISEYGTDDYASTLNHAKDLIADTLKSGNYISAEYVVEMNAQKTVDDYVLVSNENFERIVQGNLEEVFLNVLTEGESK